MKLVLATRNAGKVRELEGPLGARGIEVVTLSAYHAEPVEETGESFAENAVLKALAAVRASGEWALGEDSGLMVDALAGAPGVYSARYAGEKATDAENVAKLLEALKGKPKEERGAEFRCAMVLAAPDERTWLVEGICRGVVSDTPAGEGGFGYDPVFIPQGHERTFAQMSLEEKAILSHRGAALRGLFALLDQVIGPMIGRAVR